MSRHAAYEADDSNPPFDAREKASVRTNWKSIGLLIAGGAFAGMFYMNVKALAEQQLIFTANQVRITEQLAHEHEVINGLTWRLTNLDTQLVSLSKDVKYLVGGRRGPAPESATP